MLVIDTAIGKKTIVFLFVACLPFSGYAFVVPTLDMKRTSWTPLVVLFSAWSRR